MNTVESAAMWKSYLKSDEGVAIQSTFRRLADSFHRHTEDAVYVGEVQYHAMGVVPSGNAFSPCLFKRKSFEYEHELRAMIVRYPDGDPNFPIIDRPDSMVHGVYVATDLELLIERIYVAPGVPHWFGDVVRDVIRKYGLEVEVVTSDLASRPLY
jgi:hypothetical protein